MARPRYQKGSIRKRGKRNPVWELQWWEDYIEPDGRIGRKQESAILGLVSEMGIKQARKLAEQKLNPVNTGKAVAAFHDDARGIYRAGLCAARFPCAERLNPEALPLDTGPSSYSCARQMPLV